MKYISALIEHRKNQIARHSLYRWIQSDSIPLEDRFAFAPVFVTYIMSFSDLNKWFLRYTAPRNQLERAINEHTLEDETHSRLLLEDWRKLGFDERLGWQSCRTIEWYYSSPETEVFREYGMEIIEMCVLNPDAPVRYAFMEAIEACGHVFFAVTSQVATELTAKSGMEYRYFGDYHFQKETGHLMAETDCLGDLVLDREHRSTAERLVNRIFDMFVVENDHLLRYAVRATARHGGWLAGEAAQAGSGLGDQAARQDTPPPRRRSDGGRISRTQAPIQVLLDERKQKTAGHALFEWMRSDTGPSAKEKLRRLVPLWTPDVMGYKDLSRYALAYRNPADPYQRAINRWTADLQSHHQLFLRDWDALGLDVALGWNASETLSFYCLSRYTEIQRRNMATFVRLAYAHPAPILRFWLIEALEATGHSFFAATKCLAERVEQVTNCQLDYLADRHHVAHHVLEEDEEADAIFFKAEEISPSHRDIACDLVHAVFDRIDEQYTLSLELVANDNVFLVANDNAPLAANDNAPLVASEDVLESAG
jgi:hypothetical protein